MRQITIAATLALATLVPLPATAEEADDDGFSLMEEGARIFMRGLMQEMDPALRELEELAEELEPAFREFAIVMGPALNRLVETVDSFAYYEAPEILDNGDIIIRRRADAPPYQPETEGGTDGEIDL